MSDRRVKLRSSGRDYSYQLDTEGSVGGEGGLCGVDGLSHVGDVDEIRASTLLQTSRQISSPGCEHVVGDRWWNRGKMAV